MTDKIELKPCPFCGGEAKLTDLKQAPESWVECKECGARTRFFSNSEEAPVSAWNTRPIEDELRKELRYYRNYSAALEKEVKSLRNALDQIRITLEAKKDGIVPTRFNLDSVDGYMMLSIVKKALKAK
jgi:Lar family restriction alleviation protein